MKNQKVLIVIFFLILFIPLFSSAQDIGVHNLIGKKQSDVIKKYGNPVHKDNSNPSMLCMFYKTNTSSMIFVADGNGVYQAEATKIFGKENSARSEVDLFISNSTTGGFVVDTVTTSDFHLRKKGTKVDLQLSENKLSNKFEIKVKANKVED
jgi:hypothetical protein